MIESEDKRKRLTDTIEHWCKHTVQLMPSRLFRRLHYRINNLNQDTLKIEALIDEEFADIYEVKAWLREH